LTSLYIIDEICSASPSASSEIATTSPCDDIEFSLTALVTSLATGALFAIGGALVIILKKSPGFPLVAPNVIVLLLLETSHQSPALPFLYFFETESKTPP
jgi:hypothetical protein